MEQDAAITEAIDRFLDMLALTMANEDEWALFISMLEKRRVKLTAKKEN